MGSAISGLFLHGTGNHHLPVMRLLCRFYAHYFRYRDDFVQQKGCESMKRDSFQSLIDYFVTIIRHLVVDWLMIGSWLQHEPNELLFLWLIEKHLRSPEPPETQSPKHSAITKLHVPDQLRCQMRQRLSFMNHDACCTNCRMSTMDRMNEE
jgi:hypothetical protein